MANIKNTLQDLKDKGYRGIHLYYDNWSFDYHGVISKKFRTGGEICWDNIPSIPFRLPQKDAIEHLARKAIGADWSGWGAHPAEFVIDLMTQVVAIRYEKPYDHPSTDAYDEISYQNLSNLI